MIPEQHLLYYIFDLFDIYELVLCILCTFITQKYILMATIIIQSTIY